MSNIVWGGVLASPIVKAVLTALGVSYVIEQGSDENGNWWRRYSNGWVEQGGKAVATGEWTVITLPILFSDVNYSVSVTQYLSNRGEWNSNFSTSEHTTSSFKVWTGSAENGNGNAAFWEAKSFAA
jgi:hypothetical protein|nr:MAG TPA: hypothetical protein [Caudoviricetes sp.]